MFQQVVYLITNQIDVMNHVIISSPLNIALQRQNEFNYSHAPKSQRANIDK